MPKLKKKSEAQKANERKLATRRRREEQANRDTENASRAALLQQERQHAEFRETENARRAASFRQARSDPEFRERENSRRAASMRQEREDAEFRDSENTRRAASIRQEREDAEFRDRENARRAASIRQEREDAEFRERENAKRAASIRQEREDAEFRERENAKRAASIRQEREDAEFRERENAKRAASIRQERADVEFRDTDNARRKASHRECRQDVQQRTPEKAKDAERKHALRTNPEKRKLDLLASADINKKRRLEQRSNYEKVLEKYYAKIHEGPVFVCSCCGSALYEKSTVVTSREKLLKTNTEEYVNQVLCVQQQQHRLCHTCCSYVRKNTPDKKPPRVCLSNGLDFPEIPDVLKDLNRLEERLVTPRLPFMQIRPKGYEQQWTLKGNVVNVESNLDTVVAMLLRQLNDAAIIQCKLKRRMSYTGHYIYDKIRPGKVLGAVKYLLTTPLYIKDNILLSENWNEQFRSESVDFNISDDDENDEDSNLLEQRKITIEEQMNESGDESCLAPEETLLHHEDYVHILAPGEGNTPIPLNRDENAEFLSFPTIYAGQERTLAPNVKLTYTDIAKSELRRYDRRCAKPEKILYMFKKSFNEKVRSAYDICLRQTKRGKDGQRITAGNLLTQADIKAVIERDDAYAVFRHIRSSPAYWKEQTKRVVAMVRQLGSCTFFITLSAAESKWNELIVFLVKMLENKDITREEAAELSFEKKAELIRSDPVTCMRHFDEKYKAALGELFKAQHGVFEPHPVSDYYSRVEFQMRGSPHSHGLYWLADAPKYEDGNLESEEACTQFIDKYITCKRDEEGGMDRVIGYQIHKHSHTCRKGGGARGKCRFGYPKPPLDETLILKPLPKKHDPQLLKEASANYKKVKEALDRIDRNFKDDIPFTAFLQSVGLEKSEYLIALRTSLTRASVFLRRRTCDVFVNAYNKKTILAWQANMDIQFVLDPYACAKYCAGYILKAEGGVSKLLRELIKDVKLGKFSIQDKIQKFAKILMNGSEISAQEAVGYLLGLPNTACNRQVVYINTSRKQNRIGMLRPREELEKLPENSDDICMKGLIDHYCQRPDELEDLCLADFSSLYQFVGKQKPLKPHEDLSGDDNDKEQHDDDHSLTLRDKSGYLRKRTVRKVIRFRHFPISEPNEYWREQLMLFVPWQNEESELENIDAESVAQNRRDEILENSKPYYFDREINDCDLGAYIQEIEHQDQSQGEENEEVSNRRQIEEEQDDYAGNFLSGVKHKSTSTFGKFLAPNLKEPTEYEGLMRSLNYKQRKIVLHVLCCLKTKKEPFHIFLTGGAGVGKSHVITAIVQSYMRFCNTFTQSHPEDMCVAVSAFTGKAAFNVDGMTLHALLRLPPSQLKGKLPQLDAGLRNSLRIKFKNISLFIVDEISMVSGKMMGFIDERLREIFDTCQPFGGRYMLVVGHLRQLPPIPGGSNHHVFKPPPDNPRGALVARNALWEMFSIFELDEIMRQKGEASFCKALNNMSEGCMDEDDITLIKSREISETLKPPPDATWLFQFNKDCREKNENVHSGLKTKGLPSVAYDKVTGQGSTCQKQRLLADAMEWDLKDSDGLPYTTHLQVGGVYFISTNIDVSDGLFNGATGKLVQIDVVKAIDGTEIPKVAWIQFDNPRIGSSQRAKNPALLAQQNISQSWVPIKPFTKAINKASRYSGLQLERRNIPLIAANAMTIAKSQGSSMKLVVVSTKRKLTRENLYVACSRATSLHGLYISGIFTPPSHPGYDDVAREIQFMRTRPFPFAQRFFAEVSAQNKLYFANVTSFPKYSADLEADPHIQSSSHIAIVEPHVLDNHIVMLSGYYCFCRKNAKQTSTYGNSEGCLLFAREGTAQVVNDVDYYSKESLNSHCLIVSFVVADVTVFVCYKHPAFSATEFLSHLYTIFERTPTRKIVIGDFNIDIGANQHNIIGRFQKLGFKSLLNQDEITTQSGTQIDGCFSNFSTSRASIHETYYSYHKGICVDFT